MLHKRSTIVAAAGSLAAFLVSHQAPIGVDGHAYLMGPVSRQYWNSQVFQDEDYPNLEQCPQCYNAGGEVTVRKRGIDKTDPAVLAEYGNGYYPLRWVYDKGEMADNGNYIEPQAISVRHGVCGDPRQNQDDSWNEYGTPNSEWPILDEYTEGQDIEIKAVMSAYHWGHLEYFICNADDLDDPEGVVTQECFNMHPLTRAEGDDVNSPIDPNFSGRYYCDPECREFETDQTHDIRSAGGYVMTMNYQLPKGLTCKRCILQMVYFTGHKCRHPGYEEFNPPSWPGECAPNKEDWITLEPEYCGDKEWIYAEEFWGCADFSIMAGDGSAPEEAPTPTPSTEPVTMPTTEKPVTFDDAGEDVDTSTASPTSVFFTPTMYDDDSDFDDDASDFDDDDHSYSYETSFEYSDDWYTDVPTMSPTMTPPGEDVDTSTASPTSVFFTPTMYDDDSDFDDDASDFDDDASDFDDDDHSYSYETSFEYSYDWYTDVPTMSPTMTPPGVPQNEDEGAPEGGGEGDAECTNPVDAYEQCGGKEYTGSTCCHDGFVCTEMAACYSQCRYIQKEG